MQGCGAWEADGRSCLAQEVLQHDQDVFSAQSYLRYQGDKFVKRFDANCYVRITEMLDSHDISLGRGDFHDVLASIQQPTCIIGACRREPRVVQTMPANFQITIGVPYSPR